MKCVNLNFLRFKFKSVFGVLVALLVMFPVAAPKIYAPDGRLRPLPWEDHSVDSDLSPSS